MDINKIIARLSNKDLYEMAECLNNKKGYISEDAKIREVAAEVYLCEIKDTNLLQINGLAASIALELAHRLEKIEKNNL